MGQRREGARVLIYSHDSFGLGHLRRCREIAHAFVERRPDVSVLILSGSPIIGSFDFRTRVDFVRIPGVIKLRNGQYQSLSPQIGIRDTLSTRAAIIRCTAETFAPDLFIVDKEPLGLRGEVRDTLWQLKKRCVPLVLGLRDVLDEPAALAPEWARKRVVPALDSLYDEIWVYGLPEICDPLAGIEVPASVRRKTIYTGYLERTPPATVPEPDRPFILVTPGGGADGDLLVDWVLRAYESDADLPLPAVVVLGPFMAQEHKAEFMRRAARLDRVEMITFDTHIERLMAQASGIVAMGGYNTFCEILSFDKPAVIVPRTVPRREQWIRADRAARTGLMRMLEDDGRRDASTMAEALRRLPGQARPSSAGVAGLLGGLDTVHARSLRYLPPPAGAPAGTGAFDMAASSYGR
ncbi:MAG TPA: glycosyltransferase [Arenibaculum sp.]|nr:glycosyltransferase [Arenibaculum sp.]